MADISADTSPGPCPVAALDRVDSLDVLRGVAVLGIFVMNVQWFAMYQCANFNPTYYGMWDGAGYAIWYLSHLLAELKFMTIFSILFGAGVVLFSSRKEESREPTRKLHFRRMAWLTLFGLIHAYFIWEGDILFAYGVCGMLVYPLRNARPSRLIAVGVIVLVIGAGISLGAGASAPYWPEEQRQEFIADMWQPPPEKLAEESAAYGGRDYWGTVKYRAPGVFMMQTFVMLFGGLWRVSGMMLIGMALLKLGVLGADRSRRVYITMALGAVAGLAMAAYGVREKFAHDWEPLYAFFIGPLYNYWGSILVSLGYIGLVMLICRAGSLRRFTRPFAAAGRMAFSNYIGQSLIGVFIFYGTGLAYFNQVGRSGQILIVLCVWVLQLIVSPLWLRHYRYGPLEWVWRSLTYGKRQPFRI
jgi:uncharacterized protein